MKFRFIGWAALASLAAIIAGCSGASHVASTPSNIPAAPPPPPVIQSGVTIGGVSVGGMTAASATQAILEVVRPKSSLISVRFANPTGETYRYSLAELGGTFDIPNAVSKALTTPANTPVSLPLALSKQEVALHVSRVADLWRVPVQEARVKFSPDGSRLVVPGHSGRSVDQSKAVAAVMANLPTLTDPVVVDPLPFVTKHPEVVPDSLNGLGDTLVSFTTTFNPSNATRTNNLLLAVHNINGTVVGPGEVFSYNDSVGPRTQQTGFQDAIIYVDNRMKKDVGGGICQASSTLYNCVLLANLPIVERHAHSLPVHYVPAGRDATVAWGGDDFKWLNNTSKPIIVRATATSGGTLTESLIGDRDAMPHPDADVHIDVSAKRTYSDGFAVTSYRVVRENGVLIAKEPLGVSFYHNLVGDVPH